MDLVVRSGTVGTETGAIIADVGISNGVITDIRARLPKGREELDARGAYVLPGGVDPHTHLNTRWAPFDEERRPVDDFQHGTRAALAGGVTTGCDFVYPLEGKTIQESIEEIRAEAEQKTFADFTLHVVIELLETDLAA